MTAEDLKPEESNSKTKAMMLFLTQAWESHSIIANTLSKVQVSPLLTCMPEEWTLLPTGSMRKF